jgi:hypothetical protein
MSYIVDKAIDLTLTTGLIYRFKYIAFNAIGYSDYSDIASAAMARLPN